MDGTTKDTFFRGRLFRSLNAEQASVEYIPVVYLIAKRNTRIYRNSDASGIVQYLISDPMDSKIIHKLRKEDFDKCVSVARKMGEFRIFPSEPQSDVSGRIKALLIEEFSI